MMKEILISQNPHWLGKQKDYAKREKLATLIKYLPLKQIITITGIRRCGKSSLAKMAINHLCKEGVNPQNILFINLEHPYFLEFRHTPTYLETIYEEYLKLFNPQGRIYVVFDEIQYFENWQVYIKSKYEIEEIKYIITGSNSSMLSNELNTMLSGRSLNIHLDTFSFAEFLDYKQIAYRIELARVANKIAIAMAKEEYLRWGGFFEVMETRDESIKSEILLSYAKNIIYQDIIPRYGLRNSESIERLFFYLLSNITNTINVASLTKIFDISDKTIKEYMGYFEDVFLLKKVDKYHSKQKEQIKSFKKIYALDNGLLQIAPKHSKNLGSALENWVFTTLNRAARTVYYVKESYEIDFFDGETLYQVAYDIKDEKTRIRERRAFDSAGLEAKKLIVTFDSNEDVDGVEAVGVDLLCLAPIRVLDY